LLAESGYSGEPVTCVVAQDLQLTKAQGEVTADLRRIEQSWPHARQAFSRSPSVS